MNIGITTSGWINRLWAEFEARASELCGVFIQAFDAKGRSLQATRPLPPLCTLLQRFPTSRLACANDCHRKVALGDDGSQNSAARCHAGLSYRVVALRVKNRPPVYIQVGRVLTDVFGEEQMGGFIERHRLERHEYLQSLRESKHMSGVELERLADFVQRLAASFLYVDRRLEQRRSRLSTFRQRVAGLESQVEAFARMGERILAARTVDEILPLALETAMMSLRARRGSILLAEPEQGHITAQAFRGEHAAVAPSVTSLQPNSVSHRVFFERRPMLVQNAERELRQKSERQFPYSTRSFVSVPLRENGHSLGVLHVTEREDNDIFTPQDLELLDKLGIQASAAINKVRLEEEVRDLRVKSETDPLTGAYNRRFLDAHLIVEFERATRFGQALAAIMIDIDDFKTYNDELGHSHGDRMLRELANVIQRQVRSIDVTCRYGGDEFVLLLPGTDLGGALNTAEKIRAKVQSTQFPGEEILKGRKVTVSCGVSIYPWMALSPDDLLLKADRALLEAKKMGKNTVYSIH